MLTFFIVVVAIIWLIFDYVAIPGGFNEAVDKWLKRTLWIWLPFFALFALTKELMLRSQSKK